MKSKTTIHWQLAKSLYLKKTGHEKCMVNIFLTANSDGTTLKQLLLSVQPKEDLNHEKFDSRCAIKSCSNAWMNEELITIWVKQALGAFSFNRKLLAWDFYECHMTDSIKKDLKR